MHILVLNVFYEITIYKVQLCIEHTILEKVSKVYLWKINNNLFDVDVTQGSPETKQTKLVHFSPIFSHKILYKLQNDMI